MIDALLGFGLTDAIDIAIGSALLYVGLVHLRRSRAALVALGVALLGALYLVAHVLDLALTTGLLHGLFAALAVAIVVLFQEELRQGLEELAAWVVGRRDDHRPRLDSADVLAAALHRLAAKRVGALVVLAGTQKLDRHLQGAVPLRGVVSAELLESLFDPGSPGHDGAVVIEDRIVECFGARLPLSKNTRQLGRGGTRHCAALGLSERTDALVLVVSEERGSLSVAQSGMLVEVPTEADLAARIRAFHRDRRRLGHSQPSFSRWMRSHRREKLAAVGLASASWLALTVASHPVSKTFDVPVRVVGLRDGLRIEALDPPSVPITVRAPRADLALSDPGDLALSLDASQARSAGRRTLEIRRADVRAPEAMEVLSIARSTVELSLASISKAKMASKPAVAAAPLPRRRGAHR
jgi:uncharacterized protein (TIGR00159 family)